MDRTLRFLALPLVLLVGASACATASPRPSALHEPAPAEGAPVVRPLVLTTADLRLGGPGRTLHAALLSLQPDIVLGRDPFTRTAGVIPPTVYVNGFRVRDLNVLHDIPVTSVRKVEIVPRYAERRVGSLYEPGSVHVTLERRVSATPLRMPR
jgi:hypothetical protein